MDYKGEDEYLEESRWFPRFSWKREALIMAAISLLVWYFLAT